jgi:hypothetical protein
MDVKTSIFVIIRNAGSEYDGLGYDKRYRGQSFLSIHRIIGVIT